MGRRLQDDRRAAASGTWKRRGRLVAVVLVLGVAGGMLGSWWGERQAAVHDATAVILLNPLQGNPFSPDARGDDLINLETEAQLVTSDTVLDQLGVALAERSTVEPDEVSVVVPANTQLLSITVSARSDLEAEDAAQKLAETYLAYRGSRTSSALFSQRANIDEQIAERTRERAELVSRLDSLERGSPGSSLLTQQILAVVTQIGELRTQLGEVGSASLDPGQVVTPAVVGSAGLVPGGPRGASALGALLGLVAGCVVVSQLGRRGDVVRTRDDLADLADQGVPVWGDVPSDPGSRPAAVARLRTVLLAAHATTPLVVLTCRVSAAPSASSLALATSFASALHRTVLVGVVDPADDYIDDEHGVVPGLTEVLRDEVSLNRAVTWTDGLGLLGVGAGGDLLDDLVAAPEMGVVLLELCDQAPVVVLDAGPPTTTRAQALVAAADLVVLEVARGLASLGDVEQDVADMIAAGATRIGLVLVAAPARTPRSRGPRRRRSVVLRAVTRWWPGRRSGSVRRPVTRAPGLVVRGSRRLARPFRQTEASQARSRGSA